MSDEEVQNVRLMLENKFNDIRYTKQQQWHLIYLTLIAIGGITSLAISINPLLYCFGCFLIAFDVFIGVLGCGYIICYAYDLHIYRIEKSRYQKKLNLSSNKEKKIIDIIFFTASFCIVILCALIASIWVMTIKVF